MVGKHNHESEVKSNLKEHYKSYKVGKHWVYASIASLTMGFGLFLANNVQAHADTAPVTTGTTTSDSTQATSSVTLKPGTSAVASDTNSTSTSAARLSAATAVSTATPASEVAPVDSTSVQYGAQSDTAESETTAISATPVSSESVVNKTKSQATQINLGTATSEQVNDAKTAASTHYVLTGQPVSVTASLPQTVGTHITIDMDNTTVGYGTNQKNRSLSVTFANVKAGDVATITIPSELDTLGFNWDGTVILAANAGTTTYVRNDDGSVTVTDTFTADVPGVTIQKIGLTIPMNTAEIVPSADQSGKTITKDITTTYNGVTDATIPVTQYYQTTVTIPTSATRSQPSQAITSVLPNNTYVYEFAINDSTGFYDDSGSHRVLRNLNSGGTTITIPVPASFTLNEALTMQLNHLKSGDMTTITQTATGADIVIDVPANSGEGNVNSKYPYYLAGSYDIAQTSSEQTVSASAPATIHQVSPVGTFDATVADNSVWTEVIAAADAVDTETTATISSKGNSSGKSDILTNSKSTTLAYVNQVSLDTDSASGITDAQITINVPDGVNATAVTVPAASVSQTNDMLDKNHPYLFKSTEYTYKMTYADGTTSTGTVAADSKIIQDHDSAIRTIVLTPNYIAPGAGPFYFNIIGTLAGTYDNGDIINNGDKLIFTESVKLPSNNGVITDGKNTEIVQNSVAKAQLYFYSSSTKPGEGGGSYMSLQFNGNAGQTENYIYEPVLYFILPATNDVNHVNIPETDKAAGTQISYYTTDTGQTGVKIDYTGTGLSVNTNISSQTYQVTFKANAQDALSGQYPLAMYITSPTTALTNKTTVTDVSLTDGDSNAVLVGNSTREIETASSISSYSFAQGNQDLGVVKDGTSEVTGDATLSFLTNIVNTLAGATQSTAEIVNLPAVGDTAGSTYTFNLTGPVTLPTNFTTATGTGDSMTGTVLYSTTTYDATNTSATPDLSSYMTADQVAEAGISWDQIRSVYIDAGSIPVNESTGRIAINGTAADFPKQSGTIGYLQTMFYVDGNTPSVNDKVASIAIKGTSTVGARYHYLDVDGNDQYINLTDLTQTLTDNKDTLNESDYPATTTDFTDADLALIPTGYQLVADTDGNVTRTIVNSDHGDYSGFSNETATFGAVADYYFDGDMVQYELVGQMSATVTYVDDDDHGSTVSTATIAGAPAATGNYTVSVPTKYQLAKGQATTLAYTLTDDETDNLTVHLVHQLDTGTTTSAYTVIYTGLPANLAQPDKTGTLNWTTSTDQVTEVTTYTPTTSTTEVDSPDVTGYSADRDPVTFYAESSTTEPAAQQATVTYTADAQTVTVKYVDDDNSQVSVGTASVLNGQTGDSVTWTATLPTNYTYAKGQATSGTVILTTDNADVIIHLVHAHETGTTTTTNTVSYTGLPADKTEADRTTTTNWVTDTDKVLGTASYTPAATATTIESPTVAGYAPDQEVVMFTVAKTTTPPVGQTETVHYTASEQRVNLKYVDDDAQGAQVGKTVTISGTTDASIPWTATLPDNYDYATGQVTGGTVTLKATGNADIVVHLVHQYQAGTTTTTNTVHYTGLPTDKAEADQTTTTNWATDTDKVLGTTSYFPAATATTIESPTVDGYAPDQETVTFTVATTTTTPVDQSKTVHYTAGDQSVNLKYVDDDAQGAQVGDTQDLTGTTDQTIPWTATLPTNYDYAQGQETSGTVTFAADGNPDVVVHLVHQHQTGTLTTTNTVSYTGLPTDKAVVNQSSTTDWATDMDLVTDTTTYTPTTSGSAIESPVVDGYTANRTTATFTTVTTTILPTDQATTVRYMAGDQTVNLKYVDDDAQKAQVGDTQTLTGNTDTTVDWTTTLPTNYQYAKGQATKGTVTLTAGANDDIVIHLVHQHVIGAATTTNTVHYTGLPADKVVADQTTTTNWTTDTDKVTGTTTYTPDAASTKVASPVVTGYEPDSSTVAFTVAKTTTTPTNQVATVHYTANDQSVNVKYVDDDNGGAQVGDPQPLNGITDQTVNWTATLPTGYAYAKDQSTSGSVTLTATKNADVIIHLVHAHQVGTVTTTNTVHYTGVTEDRAPANGTAIVTWQTDTDLVTGAVTYTPDQSSTKISTPVVVGYTPDQGAVTFATSATTEVPINQTATVHYTADGQELVVNYTDDATGLSLPNLKEVVPGVTGETIAYTAQVPDGYVLAPDQAATVTKQLQADTIQNQVMIHLTHGITHQVLTTTQTVHYYLVGTTTALRPDTTQTITWLVTTDQVTGESVATAQDHYQATPAPMIDGYAAVTDEVPVIYPGATTMPQDTEAVIYYKVISDNNGLPTDGGQTGNNGGDETPTPGDDQQGNPGNETNPATPTGGDETPTPGDGQQNNPGNETNPVTPTGDDHNATPVDNDAGNNGDEGNDASTNTNTGNDGNGGVINGSDTGTTITENASGKAATSLTATESNQPTTASATRLPQTNEKDGSVWAVIGMTLASTLALFGLTDRKNRRHE